MPPTKRVTCGTGSDRTGLRRQTRADDGRTMTNGYADRRCPQVAATSTWHEGVQVSERPESGDQHDGETAELRAESSSSESAPSESTSSEPTSAESASAESASSESASSESTSAETASNESASAETAPSEKAPA